MGAWRLSRFSAAHLTSKASGADGPQRIVATPVWAYLAVFWRVCGTSLSCGYIEHRAVTSNTNGKKVPDSSKNEHERNKLVVRRWFDAMQRGATDEMQAFWTGDAANHASGRPGLRLPTGGEGIVMVAKMLRIAFPDRHWQIDKMIAEGDLVACRMTVSGTFGTRPGRPPLGMPAGQPGVEGTDL